MTGRSASILSAFLLLLAACAGGMSSVGGHDAAADGEPGMFPDVGRAYPRNLSWASIDTDGDGVLENYVSTIKQQPCGDCFVYGVTSLYEIQYQIDHGISISLDLSEQNIHNCLMISCDASGDYRTILSHIKKYGVMEETFAPTGLWGDCENCSPLLLGSVSPGSITYFRTMEYEEIVDHDMPYASRRGALVKALQTGPVVIGVGSWWGWLEGQGGVLTCWIPMGGNHVVTVIGYKEGGDLFLVKNSHGDKDFLKMAFAGGERCGFAYMAHRIPPGSTYTAWGGGESFCYSPDDRDADGVPDAHDNCPTVSNVLQTNSDTDRYGDACDRCPDLAGDDGFSCPR
jgi:hypothetical protein